VTVIKSINEEIKKDYSPAEVDAFKKILDGILQKFKAPSINMSAMQSRPPRAAGRKSIICNHVTRGRAMHHYHKLQKKLDTHPIGAPRSEEFLEILKISSIRMS